MIHQENETCNSRIIVDWLSMTVPLGGADAPTTAAQIRTALRITWGAVLGSEPPMKITPGPGRAGYHASITNEQNTITIYGRLSDTDALLEVSGQGCETLRKAGKLDDLLLLSIHSATRLDIAIDFETDVEPKEFAETCQNPRILTKSSINSPTGKTEYLGSRKSDRYCRIYRYEDPHPRSKYLRLEMVMRGALARQTVASILKAGLQEAADRASATWKFSHRIYQFMGASPIQAHRNETDMANTIRWFHVQVVPALRKLLDTEAITWEEIANAISNR